MLRSSFSYLGLAALLVGCATAGEGGGDDDDDDVDSGIELQPDAAEGTADAPPGTPDAPPGTPDAPIGVPVEITITASTSPGITAANSVACISEDANMVQLGHTVNHYFREFPLNQFGITSDFDVTEVQVGFESASAGSGTQPATLKLHTGSITNRNEIASQALSITDIAAGTVVPYSIAGTVPAGGTLIVELFTPDGTTDTNFIFIGSNQSGEQTTTYLLAPDCGINTPTDASTLAPNAMHWVLNVKGTHIP